jgi:long-chain fatty acid transport protein
MKRLGTLASTVAGLVLLVPTGSRGAGLYFAERGVRPLARGGAFVAGADDLGAVWYNPAGLVEADSSFLVDASWLRFSSDFTRRTQVFESSGTAREVESPTVHGSAPFLPIPTLAASRAFGEHKQLVGAVSLLAPYVAIASYPLTVEGEPSPSRYSLVSMEGSLLATPAVSLAWRPTDFLQVGASAQLMLGSFVATTVLGTSPDRMLSAPEDPTYDALAELRASRVLAPSANLGAILRPHEKVRVGLSAQLPFLIDAPATVKVRLPEAALFDGARQEGERARVRFKLPAVLRAGVEVRPLESLRVELGYTREFWSAHESIDITPEDVKVHGVTGLPSPFQVGAISIPRHFQDSNAFRLGAEYGLAWRSLRWEARAGVSYEQSAIPVAFLSPLTVDLARLTGSVGLGVQVGPRLRVDAVLAHVFGTDTTVAPSEAAMPRINPLTGNSLSTGAVNGGTYRARADVLGLGLRYAL